MRKVSGAPKVQSYPMPGGYSWVVLYPGSYGLWSLIIIIIIIIIITITIIIISSKDVNSYVQRQ